jgi:hypothetical protein
MQSLLDAIWQERHLVGVAAGYTICNAFHGNLDLVPLNIAISIGYIWAVHRWRPYKLLQ